MVLVIEVSDDERAHAFIIEGICAQHVFAILVITTEMCDKEILRDRRKVLSVAIHAFYLHALFLRTLRFKPAQAMWSIARRAVLALES
jgi:hypothetical protein